MKVPCCDAAGENTSPRTGGSNHPGLAKGAKPLRLHRYFRGSLVLKFYLLGQVVQFSLWRGQRIVPRTMSMGKRGKLAARSVAAVWQPVNSWSISRACLRLNTQAQTNFSKPHTKVLTPFVLRLIFAQLRNEESATFHLRAFVVFNSALICE